MTQRQQPQEGEMSIIESDFFTFCISLVGREAQVSFIDQSQTALKQKQYIPS